MHTHQEMKSLESASSIIWRYLQPNLSFHGDLLAGEISQLFVFDEDPLCLN